MKVAQFYDQIKAFIDNGEGTTYELGFNDAVELLTDLTLMLNELQFTKQLGGNDDEVR